MSGKVFHAGYQTFALHSECVGRSLFPYDLRVFAKAAHPDNRVGRVGIDIGNRCEIHMDAHSQALLRDLLAHIINQFVVGDGAKRHLIRIGDGVFKSHSEAPFRVNANHDGRLSLCLPSVGLFHLRYQVVAEEAHSTNVILLDILRNFLIIRFVGLIGAHTNQLGHALLQSETVVNRIHPAVFGGLGESSSGRQGQNKRKN